MFSQSEFCEWIEERFEFASDVQMASPDENAMMSRVTNLEDAIKGMKGISDHLGSKKGMHD